MKTKEKCRTQNGFWTGFCIGAFASGIVAVAVLVIFWMFF